MDATNSNSSKLVTALARGLTILECFSEDTPELSNGEIAQRTGLAKSTVTRLTYTLTALGYLTHHPAHERYQLGGAALVLGYRYLAHSGVQRLAAPAMQRLANDVGHSIALGILDKQDAVYLHVANSTNHYGLRLGTGSRLPLLDTAMGRALICAHRLHQRVIELPDSAEPLIAKAMSEFQQWGACFSLGDWQPDINAAAVPVVPVGGAEIMALNCGGGPQLLTEDRLRNEIRPALQACAEEITQALSGR